jgi:2-polyprenyl-3-methyl-5-hydroxy-6-metoxy-1,4-benzoquinol methylase
VRYARRHVLAYEWVWGRAWVSPGGLETTRALLQRAVGGQGGQRPAGAPPLQLLDIGSGSGGAALLAAAEHGAEVTGVDVARDMVALAEEHRAALAPGIGFLSERDAELVRKSGQRQPFIAVLPQECMGQLASFGPT